MIIRGCVLFVGRLVGCELMDIVMLELLHIMIACEYLAVLYQNG